MSSTKQGIRFVPKISLQAYTAAYFRKHKMPKNSNQIRMFSQRQQPARLGTHTISNPPRKPLSIRRTSAHSYPLLYDGGSRLFRDEVAWRLPGRTIGDVFLLLQSWVGGLILAFSSAPGSSDLERADM